MSLGLVGRKIGMTRLFTDEGVSIPVTVLDVSNNRVAQVKTPAADGYAAVQVAFGTKKASRVGKPLAGHMAKAGVEAGSVLREFHVDADTLERLKPGDVVGVDVFSEGQLVDVIGVSIGKGFQGGIKRHNFSSNRASHGNSVSHKTVGSISMAQDPGRVFPGKKLPGQMGAVRRTMQSLQVVRIDAARNLIMVKGAVPGAKGGDVIVRPAVKASV